jgi:hypothetical protein
VPVDAIDEVWVHAQPSLRTTTERVLAVSHEEADHLPASCPAGRTEALPPIIAHLRAQGYRFLSPAEPFWPPPASRRGG